jgi:hypothetical protein
MTVGELLDALKNQPRDREVTFTTPNGQVWTPEKPKEQNDARK